MFVTLPKQLPSRLTTLQKACLAKVFEANPLACAKESPGSEVGTATAITPTLPVPMTGPAFLVSHGGEEFPALELVLEGAGANRSDIVRCGVFLKNGGDFEAMNEAYVAFFGDHRPARSTVQVAALPGGAEVEIEVWAYLPR